jgi:uncharacterized protein
MRAIALLLIRLYQALTPSVFRGACRHHPTCSEYAREAIARHGVWRGGRIALGRIVRCHPLGTAGYDPVP